MASASLSRGAALPLSLRASGGRLREQREQELAENFCWFLLGIKTRFTLLPPPTWVKRPEIDCSRLGPVRWFL